MAQALIDAGVLSRDGPVPRGLAHTLSSSLGGGQTDPVVTSLEMSWDTVLLLCSDGLTNHVSDERISEQLRSMTSARQGCEDLLREALDGGGTDNITIIIGRVVPRQG
jgi:protein phosphatase